MNVPPHISYQCQIKKYKMEVNMIKFECNTYSSSDQQTQTPSKYLLYSKCHYDQSSNMVGPLSLTTEN